MPRQIGFWLSCAGALVLAQSPEMAPIDMGWRTGEGVLVDAGPMLDAPAGRGGFISIKNGRLATGDGRRWRAWGVNFSFRASMPAKEDAPLVAAHLARFGVNCVRIHHFDWRTPRGVIDSRYPDSRHLDPDSLDRFDFLVHQLKQRGIYINLNLNVGRQFDRQDGVKEYDRLGFAKALTLFDPRMIELQKEYARQLLTHRNPYTGSEYRHEPAVAMVEMVNENSIIEAWKAGRLRGKLEGGPRDTTWSDIPAAYARDLDERYHAWLKARGGPPVARLEPEEFATADSARFRAEASFYLELEDRFFQDMYAFLKRELGVRAPLVGTSIHNGGITPYALLASTSKMDIVDAHTYWQHPRYGEGRKTWDILNTPMVDQPERSTVVTLGRVAVKGKPFIVSEVNHPYPSEWAAEGIPVLAAYGAFQDWDGIFWYSFEHNVAADWGKRLPNFFDIRGDPVKMSQVAAAGVMFRRGDVRAARRLVVRNYSREQVIESLRSGREHAPWFSPGLAPLIAHLHRTRVGSLNGPATKPPSLNVGRTLVSDTGELAWDRDGEHSGVVVVNTPRAQAAVGFLKRVRQWPRNLKIETAAPFAAVLLVSLDGAPLNRSARMVLTAGARVAASGMTWNEKRTTTTDPGRLPMTAEIIKGTAEFRGFAGAKGVTLTPLDGAGRAVSAGTPAEPGGDAWRCPLGASPAVWYLVEVRR